MKAARKVILVKPETTYAADSVPTTATDVLLVENFSIDPLEMETEDYAPVSDKFGAFEKIIGAQWSQVSFDIVVSGGGTPLGSAPAQDAVNRASGMARVITPGVSVIYNPIDTGEESVSLYYFVDGVRQRVLGLRGDISWTMEAKKAPRLRFTGKGLQTAMTDTTLPVNVLPPTLQRALAINRTNTQVQIDATYNLKLASMQLNLGNDVQYRNFCNQESVDIVQRMTTGKVKFELPLVASQDFLGASGICRLGTKVSLGMTHGLVAGNRAIWFMPEIQLLNPKQTAEQGIVMLECDMHVVRNQLFISYT